jgi:Rer1 family
MDEASHHAARLNTKLQQFLDKTAPFKLYRWLALAALVLLYATRVFFLKGFYIVTYAARSFL